MQLDRNCIDRAGLDRSWPCGLVVTLSAEIDSQSSVYAVTNVIPILTADISSTSDQYSRLALVQLMQSIINSESDVFSQIYYIQLLSSDLTSSSDLYAQLRQIDSIEFTFSGTLAAGETVCIDGRKFTVKNNGANAVDKFSGDYPSIFAGTNWIIYTDEEGSRTLQLRVSKRDRKV